MTTFGLIFVAVFAWAPGGAAAYAWAPTQTGSWALQASAQDSLGPRNICAPSRRSLLVSFGLGQLAFCRPATAFDNRQPGIELFPSLNGVPYGTKTAVPSGVGVETAQLRGCPSTEGTARPAPNCFSSTVPKPTGSDQLYYVAPFAYAGKDAAQAMKELVAVAMVYTPGQAKIDAGGWKIVKQTDRYLYIQFESGGIGYIDDMEFMLDDAKQLVLLRSASRTGFLDFSVNAKRVNWFAAALAARGGWTTRPITPDDHPDYFNQNGNE